MEQPEETLRRIRWKIDVLDVMMADLMAERLALSLRAQALKESVGRPAEDLERESEIRRRMASRGREAEELATAAVAICRESYERRRGAASGTCPERAGSSTPP